MYSHKAVFLSAITFALLGTFSIRTQGATTILANEGKSLMPVVVAGDAPEALKITARTLADYLGRISGGRFELRENGQIQGIRLRLLPGVPVPEHREDYSIRSFADRLELIGTTPLAIQDAVWDLLHRLGHRQFFPGAKWEIIPSLKTIAVTLDVTESPDYLSRRIWYGYGPWDYAAEPYRVWNERNRMGGGVSLHTGHAYGGIIRAKKAAFDQHPEYYALVNGRRNIKPQAKLCIGNPALRRTVVEYALEYFEKRPEEDSISMDPSDGGGWCECEPCAKTGSVSDRALLLANEVAGAVNRRYPGKLVGMYAYSYHSPPPAIRAHPRVIISVATAFVKGGISVDQIMKGWAKKGATVGIREYYSVNTWDRDLPGAARGARLDYLAQSIPDFHAKGARHLSAESSDNWGCNGLGYYFAGRVMWDTEEAKRQNEIVEDFLAKAFGPAKKPMREFYALIEGGNKQARLVYSDLLGRMYRCLDRARQLTSDEAIGGRLDDLTLYTRYVELFDQYRNAQGAKRQTTFEALIRHGYRMRGTMMIHTKALYRDLAARDKSVKIPEDSKWNIPEPKNPWKSSEPFSPGDYGDFIRSGIGHNVLVELDFEPRDFSEMLMPAESLGLQVKSPGEASRGRGMRSWFTRVNKTPAAIELNVTGGLIKHYRDRGNVKVDLWRLGGASETGEAETLVKCDRSVPPDGVERIIRFAIAEPGLYRVDVNDGMDLTQVTWPATQVMTWKMTLEEQPRMISGRWSLHFFVPRGTRKIGLYLDAGGGSILCPDGTTALKITRQNGTFISLEVPVGMDGQLWRLNQIAGKVALLNVPPYLAQTPEQLLLPAEVVQSVTNK